LATLGKPLIIIYKNTTTAKQIRLEKNTLTNHNIITSLTPNHNIPRHDSLNLTAHK